MDFKDKLIAIQAELKAPKDKYNSFGKYAYRSAESILEAVKPLLKKYGVFLKLTDEVVEIGGRVFCRAMAMITDCESEKSDYVLAFAEIANEKKGMDVSQITGTASSYARKYALNGLFLIDDNKDADTDEYQGGRKSEPEDEGEKMRQEVAAMKIDLVKAKSLEARLKSMNVKVPDLLARYGVENITDLTEGQHYEIIEKLRKHEGKKR